MRHSSCCTHCGICRYRRSQNFRSRGGPSQRNSENAQLQSCVAIQGCINPLGRILAAGDPVYDIAALVAAKTEPVAGPFGSISSAYARVKGPLCVGLLEIGFNDDVPHIARDHLELEHYGFAAHISGRSRRRPPLYCKTGTLPIPGVSSIVLLTGVSGRGMLRRSWTHGSE